jgi:hypothetical protein
VVQVADAFKVKLVVGEVQDFKIVKVLLAQGRYYTDGVELQVELLEEFQIAQLLHSHFVVCQVKSGQVLEVAQIFFDNVDDLLRGQL